MSSKTNQRFSATFKRISAQRSKAPSNPELKKQSSKTNRRLSATFKRLSAKIGKDKDSSPKPAVNKQETGTRRMSSSRNIPGTRRMSSSRTIIGRLSSSFSTPEPEDNDTDNGMRRARSWQRLVLEEIEIRDILEREEKENQNDLENEGDEILWKYLPKPPAEPYPFGKNSRRSEKVENIDSNSKAKRGEGSTQEPVKNLSKKSLEVDAQKVDVKLDTSSRALSSSEEGTPESLPPSFPKQSAHTDNYIQDSI